MSDSTEISESIDRLELAVDRLSASFDKLEAAVLNIAATREGKA